MIVADHQLRSHTTGPFGLFRPDHMFTYSELQPFPTISFDEVLHSLIATKNLVLSPPVARSRLHLYQGFTFLMNRILWSQEIESYSPSKSDTMVLLAT
jgi:hypothetical protein